MMMKKSKYYQLIVLHFLVHNKVSESINVNINTNKLYYTEEDIQLLLQSQLNNNNITSSSATGSNDTLISFGNNVSQDSLVKPLTISKETNHHH